MNSRISKLSLAVCAALTMALGLGSCKENTIISSNVTPAVDNIHTFQLYLSDSFFEAKTVRDDSIVTNSAAFSIYQAIGWVQDDLARTVGSTYLQVVPTTTGAKLPSDEVIDSVVAILPYAGFTWGDTINSSSYTINAYQITDTLSIGAVYYPFTQKSTGNTIVGTGTFRVGPRGSGVIADSVIVDGVRVAPHLRVKLNNSIGNTIRAALDTNTSFAGFIGAFPGIYFVPDTSGPGRALPYFLVDGTVDRYAGANILMYTHNSTNRDTAYSLPYNSTYASRYNRISRTFTNTSIFDPNSQVLALENQPGAAIDFRFKNLDKLTAIPPTSVLNKVEIIFTKKTDASIDPYFFAPGRIYPYGISSSGIRYTVLDRGTSSTTDGLNFIDGTPRDSAGVIKYTLNIPRELQSAITSSQSDLHLLITGTATYPGAYRLLVGSMNNIDPAKRPIVRIIYSKQN